jgi:hypothetical protein
MAIEWMVKKHGLNNVGLLTLTFGVPGSGRGSQATKELREQAKDLEFVQQALAFVKHQYHRQALPRLDLHPGTAQGWRLAPACRRGD